MRIPKTSRRPSEPLREVALGKGDYVAGGARSLPFLDLDGARRRRPLVFGEVTDDLASYPELAAGMFSGRQTDPEEWAVMWKEIGADGVWMDLHGNDPDLARRVAERTRMPVAVKADDDVLSGLSGYRDSAMVLVGRDGDYAGDAGDHSVAVTGEDADEISAKCLALEGSERCMILVRGFDIAPGLRGCVDTVEELRRRALSGDDAVDHPIIADVTGCWSRGFGDARSASMWEAESALAAMLAGADVIVVRGPGAADMARVYGEELADL